MANPTGKNQYSGGKRLTGAAKAQRIAILEGRLNRFSVRVPLREQAAVVKELRSMGWGRRK